MSHKAPSVKDRVRETLPGVPEDIYGATYREHVLEIYKTFVEMTDRISQRRDKANAFFLAVNTAVIALLAKGALSKADNSAALEFLIPAAGVVLCYLWRRIIRSYRDLNTAKFEVVHAIERQLPLRPYDAEWEAVERGECPKLYLSFTRVERWVPFVFIAFYAILAGTAIPWDILWRVVGTTTQP